MQHVCDGVITNACIGFIRYLQIPKNLRNVNNEFEQLFCNLPQFKGNEQ
jgi:hypothetical protein